MTWLAPGFLYASLAVAAAVAALHFIVKRQPRAGILPTARFVPDTPATTVASSRRPSDVPLMLLRMLAVLAAGAGLAKPVLTGSRSADARVIVVDVSRSAGDSIAIRDSVRAVYRERDAIVLFDSAARVVRSGMADTIGSLRPGPRRGNLSAAIIAALRAGSSLRDRADSVELVIVSPFASEELDAATDTIRSLWPGGARLIRIVRSSGSPAPVHRLEINGGAEDPLAVTLQIARNSVTGNAIIDRSTGTSGRNADALIAWPVSARPRFAIARAKVDTVGGFTTGDASVVAAFGRQWSFPPDSLRGAEVIARWVDGEPAAIEKPDGSGCVRSVAIPVTSVGDLVIRRDFVRFVTSLAGTCAAVTALTLADPATIARLERSGGLAPRQSFPALSDAQSGLAPWLFALAIAAAIAELLVRRRGRAITEVDATRRAANREARAA